MEPFIGQIIMFGGNFAPRGWALCDGQLLPISSHTALFSILGTTYGGDGRTTFGLPDLRGRSPMHEGNGPGLPTVQLGAKLGNSSTTLDVNHLPEHSHTGVAKCVAGPGNANTAAGNFFSADAGNQSATYHSGPATADMGAASIQTDATGSGTAFSNQSPVQVVNFIIALVGTFPSRN